MTQALKRGGGGGPGFIGLVEQPPGVAYIEAYYTYGMGKGLSEPCPPYREANVFGAPLNIPNASNWNCVPQIIEPTSSFDLSLITPYHEVVVALLAGHDLPAGASYSVHQRWYRDRDGQLLFDFAYTIPDPGDYGYTSWLWYYVYSYIGYVPWEIWENGGYHVVLTLSGGGQSFSQTLNFTVTGIAEEPELAGQIVMVLIWHEPLTAWETVTPGREIPLNENIYLLQYWRNDSGVSIVGHGDLEVTYPDGTKHTLLAPLHQDKEAAPGDSEYVEFEPFLSSQEGTYTVKATLSSQGQVLDSVTFELVVVEAVVIVPCQIFIDAPDSANEGEAVSVSATIKNISANPYYYKTEIYAGVDLISSIAETIPSGSLKTYTASFVMPGADITILVWVERWSIDYWVYDNAASKVVSLAAVVPEPQFRDFAVEEYTKV